MDSHRGRLQAQFSGTRRREALAPISCSQPELSGSHQRPTDPSMENDLIQLDQGSGGRAMHELIERLFLAAFSNPLLLDRNDSAVFDLDAGKLAMTTDSYVVDPIFFPGGNIGSLAVHGTVNDLAMRGAKPLFMSVGLILEEGMSRRELAVILAAMREAADGAGIAIVTGDTKVVP